MRKLLLAAALTSAIAGCEKEDMNMPSINEVIVMPQMITVEVGQTQQFNANARDGNGNNVGAEFIWSSSDTMIATIGANGLARGVRVGSTQIRAVAGGGAFGTATLTVVDPGSRAQLMVMRTGTGIGDVVSQPAGIDCGMTCSASFNAGEMVMLTANPIADSSFAGWSGDCGGTGPCVVMMNGPKNVTAQFERGMLSQVQVSIEGGTGTGRVVSAPAGIDCARTASGTSGTCQAPFDAGTEVTLTAMPDADSRLSMWSGPCSGSDTTCTIRVAPNNFISARFDRLPGLTVEISGSGSGRVISDPPGIDCTGNPCFAPFPENSTVIVRAIPDDDSTFSGFDRGDPCGGQSDACRVTILFQGSTIHASFSDWRVRLSFPPHLGDIVEYNNQLISLGAKDLGMVSAEGINFKAIPTVSWEKIHAMAASSSGVIAAGENGTILHSADGTTWAVASSGTTEHLRAAVYSETLGGFFVAGDRGTILHSIDGVTWNARTSNTIEDLLAIDASASEVMASGYAGTLVASIDGMTWSTRMSGTVQPLAGIAFGVDRWVAVGGGGAIVRSLDGMMWEVETASTTAPWVGVAHDGVEFIAANAELPGASSKLYASSDGAQWTHRNRQPSSREPFTAIAYEGDQWFAISADAAIIGSYDGINWTYRIGPCSDAAPGVHDSTAYWAIGHGDGTYIAVGSGHAISTSPDGREWTSRKGEAIGNTLSAIAYGNGTWVTGGWQGAIYTSIDGGLTWSSQTFGSTPYLSGIVFAESLFVAVGGIDNGMGYVAEIRTSPDGVIWTPRDTTGIGQLNAIAHGEDQFVAVGSNGVVATSPDGIVWTPRNVGMTVNLGGVTFGDGKFVASAGTDVMVSDDGITWNRHAVNQGSMGAMAYGNGTFVSVSNGIWTSTDAINWRFETPIGPQLLGVAYGDSGFVAGGIFRLIAAHP